MIIDTTLSVVFMVYLSAVVLEYIVGVVFIAPMILIYWFGIIVLCTGLLIASWILKGNEKNTGSIILSILALVVSVSCLILGILIRY